jgi:hypothetical protein
MRRKCNHNFDAISAFMFYHHDSPFQVMMLSSYPSNWFLLSGRGTEHDRDECPVGIKSLCALHNAIASFRFKISDGNDLSKDAGFKNLQSNWSLYQKKHAARCEMMKRVHRIHAVIAGRDICSFPNSCALLGSPWDIKRPVCGRERRQVLDVFVLSPSRERELLAAFQIF